MRPCRFLKETWFEEVTLDAGVVSQGARAGRHIVDLPRSFRADLVAAFVRLQQGVRHG
jgi:hypothetical protein